MIGNFYSHAPRGARQIHTMRTELLLISTHTPLARRDVIRLICLNCQAFLLTRPSRGATTFRKMTSTTIYFYSHAPRGARQGKMSRAFEHIISTHTPLAGRDYSGQTYVNSVLNFYSHAPRGARLFTVDEPEEGKISTHTPLAGRDSASISVSCSRIISTHTPLAGRDLYFKGFPVF